jgi:hypothetical protein
VVNMNAYQLVEKIQETFNEEKKDCYSNGGYYFSLDHVEAFLNKLKSYGIRLQNNWIKEFQKVNKTAQAKDMYNDVMELNPDKVTSFVFLEEYTDKCLYKKRTLYGMPVDFHFDKTDNELYFTMSGHGEVSVSQWLCIGRTHNISYNQLGNNEGIYICDSDNIKRKFGTQVFAKIDLSGEKIKLTDFEGKEMEW